MEFGIGLRQPHTEKAIRMKCDKDQGDQCLVVETSSSVIILSSGSITLTWIALYVSRQRELVRVLARLCTLLIHV